nr:hypothetical protein [Tanacetum cinerariifolium]
TLKSKGLAIQKILICILTWSTHESAVDTLASISYSTVVAVIGATALAAVAAALAVAEPRVPESVLKPLTTVPVGMKHVQPMSLSMTPVKRYDNPKCGCESYMPTAPGELPNSIPLTVPNPL